MDSHAGLVQQCTSFDWIGPRRQTVLPRGLRHDQIEKAVLAGFDWGARTANIVAALRPECREAMVSVNGYPINTLKHDKPPMAPKIELRSRRITASPIAWNKAQKP